jgi:hypothetical protein
MFGYLLCAGKNVHPICMEQDFHAISGITTLYGISVFIHNDHGILVDPTGGSLEIAEDSFRKGKKMFLLFFIQRAHVPITTGHLVIPIRNALPENLLV